MDYRIEQLRYLLREDPSSRIFFQLGELLRREGEAVQAVQVLESGLERHPRYVAAWVSLGRSQRDLHALAEAEHAFETALEIDRENPVAARLLGETAMEREDWLGAVKALKLTRALAGGDAELDAKIALVEERLDGDGRLEQPPEAEAKVETKVEPPARCLEIVNLSADDPFSASLDEADTVGVMSDVFDLADIESAEVAEIGESHLDLPEAEDSVVEESPEPDEEAVDEPVVEETLISDDADEVEIEATEEDLAAVGPETPDTETTDPGMVDTATMDTGTVDEEAVRCPEPMPAVDESSVGAWSATMKAAGVSGEEAWTEPTDELTVGEQELSTDGPWIEPTAAVDVVEAAPDKPIEVVDETQEEPPSEEAQVAVEPESDVPSGDEAPPVETQTLDPIEVTHPDVVEQRATEFEAETEAEEPPTPEMDEPPVEEEPEILDEPAGDELLPGEDRGFDTSGLTRPIAIPPETLPPEPAMESTAEAAEAVDDETGGDETTSADKRHELEHGVPLPTMTLAKLALDQGDRVLAMATLESLIERDPTNTEAGGLLGELQAQEAKIENRKLRAVQATSKITALQGWLDAVRLAAERRVP